MDVSLRDQVRATTLAIGGRIRAGRHLRGMSQETLAACLGITFQQVQKYENGSNRIAACTLLAASKALDLEVGFFLPAGVTPIGRAELAAIRTDVAATVEAVDRAVHALHDLRRRLVAAEARLSDPAPSPLVPA